MTGFALRLAAFVCFALATFGVATAYPLIPLGLAFFVAGTLVS